MYIQCQSEIKKRSQIVDLIYPEFFAANIFQYFRLNGYELVNVWLQRCYVNAKTVIYL